MKRILSGVMIAAVCIAPLLPSTGLAEDSNAGVFSFQITPGARADGMGRAFVALPGDATANWWNPAALASQTERHVSLMHAQLVPDLAEDVYYEFMGYSMPLSNWGGIGASLVYLGYGKSEATDTEGQVLGIFSSYEISPQVAIGTEVAPGLYAGANLKYVYVSLAPAWATGTGQAGNGDTFAADLALLWHLGKLLPIPVNIGVNVQNLGPNISYISRDQSDPIPRNLKLGTAVQVFQVGDFSMLGSYDFNKSLVHVKNVKQLWNGEAERPIMNYGTELSFRNGNIGAALRAGYIHDRQGEIMDPTFGVGFAIGSFALDYASVPQARILNRVSKFSVNWKF